MPPLRVSKMAKYIRKTKIRYFCSICSKDTNDLFIFRVPTTNISIFVCRICLQEIVKEAIEAMAKNA